MVRCSCISPRAKDAEARLAACSLSGGSPAALNELAEQGRLPGYVTEMVRDWILGEFAGQRAEVGLAETRAGSCNGAWLPGRRAQERRRLHLRLTGAGSKTSG